MSTYPVAPVGPGPAVHGFAVTPSDTTPLPSVTRYIWVGTSSGGNLSVILAGDSAATVLKAVPAGTKLELAASYVTATNTTVSDIVGLY